MTTPFIARWPVGAELALQASSRCFQRYPAPAPWAAFCGAPADLPGRKCLAHEPRSIAPIEEVTIDATGTVSFGDLTRPENWKDYRRIFEQLAQRGEQSASE